MATTQTLQPGESVTIQLRTEQPIPASLAGDTATVVFALPSGASASTSLAVQGGTHGPVPQPAGAPQDVTVQVTWLKGGQVNAEVTWQPPAGGSGPYTVQAVDQSGTPVSTPVGAEIGPWQTSTPQIVFAGLTATSKAWIRIRAGSGPWTNPVLVALPAVQLGPVVTPGQPPNWTGYQFGFTLLDVSTGNGSPANDLKQWTVDSLRAQLLVTRVGGPPAEYLSKSYLQVTGTLVVGGQTIKLVPNQIAVIEDTHAVSVDLYGPAIITFSGPATLTLHLALASNGQVVDGGAQTASFTVQAGTVPQTVTLSAPFLSYTGTQQEIVALTPGNTAHLQSPVDIGTLTLDVEATNHGQFISRANLVATISDSATGQVAAHLSTQRYFYAIGPGATFGVNAEDTDTTRGALPTGRTWDITAQVWDEASDAFLTQVNWPRIMST